MSPPARYGGESLAHAARGDGSDGQRRDREREGWERKRRSTTDSPGRLRITLKVPPAEPRDDRDDGRRKKPRGTLTSPSLYPDPTNKLEATGAGDGDGDGSDSEQQHRPAIPSFISALSAPSWPEEFGGPATSGVAVGATAKGSASASTSDDTPPSSGRRRRFKKEAKRRREPSSTYDDYKDDDRKPSALKTNPIKEPPSHVLFQGLVPAKPRSPVGGHDEEGRGHVAADGAGGDGLRRSGRRRRYTSRGERWEAKATDDNDGETTRAREKSLAATATEAGRNDDNSLSHSSRPPPNHVLFQQPPKKVKINRQEPRRRKDLDLESDPASGRKGQPNAAERWYGGCVPLLRTGEEERLPEPQRSIRRHLELFAASPGDVAGGVFRADSSPSGEKKEKGDPSAPKDRIKDDVETAGDVVEALRVGIRCVHCRLAASVGAVGGGRYERFEIGTHREYYPTHFYLPDGSFKGPGPSTGGVGDEAATTVAPHLPPGAFSFPESLSTLNGSGVLRHLDHFLSHCPYLPAEERTRLSGLHNGGGHLESNAPAPDGGDFAELADGIGLVELREGRGLRFGRDPLLRPAAAVGGGGGGADMVAAVSALAPDEPMDPGYMDDECRKYFKEAVADFRSWSSASCRTAATEFAAGPGGMGGPLLRPDDRQLVTDFRFLCFAQLRVIHFETADMEVRNKQPNLIPIPLGYAGFCCRFCGERAGASSGAGGDEGPSSVDDDDTSKKAEDEYFIADDGRRMKRRPKQPPPPTTGRFFPSSHSSLSGCNDHLYRCRYVPEGLKRCLKALQPLNKVQINRLRKASHARHKVLIWSRLRDADQEVKEDVENSPDTSTTENAHVSHALGPKDAAKTSEDNIPVREETIEEKKEGWNDGSSSAGGKGNEPSSKGSENGGTGPVDVTQAGAAPDPNILNQYGFVQTPTGWWTCKRCCMVPLDLRSKGCLTMTPPSEEHMRQHLSICCGDGFNLLAATKAVDGMSQCGIIKVDDIVLPAFRSIVRELVGGHHQLVSVFTYGVRHILKGGEAAAKDVSTCGLWSDFPSQVNEEAVTALLKSLPFSSDDDEGRPSCLIVTNNHFRDYVHLLAPGFNLPTMSALMSRRV